MNCRVIIIWEGWSVKSLASYWELLRMVVLRLHDYFVVIVIIVKLVITVVTHLRFSSLMFGYTSGQIWTHFWKVWGWHWWTLFWEATQIRLGCWSSIMTHLTLCSASVCTLTCHFVVSNCTSTILNERRRLLLAFTLVSVLEDNLWLFSLDCSLWTDLHAHSTYRTVVGSLPGLLIRFIIFEHLLMIHVI